MYSSASLYSNIMLNAYIRPPIVLCLFTGSDCVSSITINLDDDNLSNLSIDSKTNTRYEGRKFNTLLRAVLIIISKSISDHVQQITSSAINEISATLMIKRFNAVSRTGLSKDTPQIDEMIKTVFSQPPFGMETYVELNEVNIANAARVFDETIKRMNCGPLQGGMKRTRKPRKQRKQRNQKKQRKTKRTRKPH